MVINRFDVYLINLDPTVGSEIKKMRPCLVLSPDEINHNVRTVIVAPMTTKSRPFPSRAPCRFQGQNGVVLDHSHGGSVKADQEARQNRQQNGGRGA